MKELQGKTLTSIWIGTNFAPLFLITYDTTFASTAEKIDELASGQLVGSLGRQDRTGLSREFFMIPHYSLFLDTAGS